jgi:hypothetical protein
VLARNTKKSSVALLHVALVGHGGVPAAAARAMVVDAVVGSLLGPGGLAMSEPAID